MITKAQMEKLVEGGAIERDLQRLLKQDLSVFADMYANPTDEYICFSEFPIGDTGNVDFAVFTHRSRMSIYLIEVKGANFNLVNQSKETFYTDLLEGIDQITRRRDYIERNYSKFCLDVHDIRYKVESNRPQYNSLLCPKGFLNVDAKKDVNVYCVVIGGRTVHDLEESKKRNTWGRQNSIQLESWDSWLGKVKRS
ncbi:Shedu immune nuclease family protein [Cytobacillus praedii]|uniref:Shedu immune nuclease family protein n=1 Tax=Cytobacillus praedii TaxID=1742358 RepID=UPI002E23BD7E|nr:DUF4263 domain-containing protein [Cytobacillus praedii]